MPKRSKRSFRSRNRKVSRKAAHHIIHRQVPFVLAKFAADTGFYTAYKLNQFPGVSDLRSLYQDYKIKSIRLTFNLINAPNNNSTFPTLIIAPQHYNGALGTVTVGSRDEISQYKGVRVFQFGPNKVTYTQVFKPWLAMAGAGAGLMPIPWPWVSTINDDVNIVTNGYWLARYNTGSDPTHTIELTVSAVIECRGTR